MVDVLLDVGRDHNVLAAQSSTELWLALDLLAETHTARAVDAARHVCRHERSDVFVFDNALAVVVPRNVAAVAHRQVLQFAFAALVADRAVERMVDEQELHRRFLRGDGARRLGEDLHALGNRLGTGRDRLGRALDINETHATVGGHAEFLVVAESRHVGADRVGHLDEHLAWSRFDRLAVDFNVDDVVSHKR